jgi:predicted amidohydrolase YtcJ
MGLSAATDWWPRGQCALDIEYNGGTRGARIKKNHFMDWYNDVAQAGLRSANSHVSGNDSYIRLISEWERIDKAKPGSVKGWAFDHCTLISPELVPRAAKLGLMASCNALGDDTGRVMGTAFGEDVAHNYISPVKSLLDAGINVSLEGDWSDIGSLITRKDAQGKVWGPNQRVDRKTALKIATQNGANYVLKGDKLGSIEAGKFADLLVLDRDYMSIPEQDITAIRPLMTMMGGKFIFLHTDFSSEYNLKPAGTLISTHEELQKRRPAGSFGGGGD